MLIKETDAARQREIAVDLARRVIHDGQIAAVVGAEYGLEPSGVWYLLRKFGLWNRRAARGTGDSRPAFLRRGGDLTFDDLILMRRNGETWAVIAAKFGNTNVSSFMKTVRYHCRNRGVVWPIETGL